MKSYKKFSRKSPLISVIMPVKDGEKYLGTAIESIRNQTITNWEMIIVNDGSTDETAKILAQYAKKDRRIIILENKKNLGLAASLNKTLKQAKGRYIARMDADDISLPKRFEKQIKLLKTNPSLVAVGGQEEIIDQNGQIKAIKHFPTDPELCYQTLANFMPIQPPLLMARANVFKKYRYDTKHCRNDDIDIYFKLLQKGSFSNVDEVIFQYRQLGTSLTHKNAKAVYFMALKSRLRGMVKYGYRPSYSRITLLTLETIFVVLIPSRLLIKSFEFLRYQQPKPIFSPPSWALAVLKLKK